VACGTGANFRHYPPRARVVAVDLSQKMLRVARRRARRLGLEARFAIMDGGRLAVRDGAFETVFSSMSLCTFPDPIAALREMARALRPGGRILLLEHGRSDRGWVGRWQDRRQARHHKSLGCRMTQHPPDLVRQAGLDLRRSRRTFLGIFHLMEAAPGAPTGAAPAAGAAPATGTGAAPGRQPAP
jgi:ubiquinone/menaquinone biosynthesis C-methylase UbiE